MLFDRQANELDKADVQRVIDTAQAGATRGLEVELGGQAIQIAEQAPQGAGELIGVPSPSSCSCSCSDRWPR